VSRAVGIPEGIPGLGVAAADVNNDLWPDLFLSSHKGGNVLFLNDGRGKFREAPDGRKVFAWPAGRGDDMVGGVCVGDVNRDGLLDIVIGQHYEAPWKTPVPVRLYLNRGVKDGNPSFEDVTDSVGLTPLPMKAPHVEVQDFDNDGWPDIYVSVVKFADGKPCPVIFRNQGVKDGLPRFRDDALAVNDFPTAEDKAVKRSGELFQKLLKEKKIIYTAPGPSGDFDNDGRLDLFLASWWPEARSLLLRNETAGGHWLDVRVDGAKGINRMGIGSRVRVYAEGQLIGCQDIATGFGYASAHAAVAHFGLGKAESVDVEVTLPHGKGKVVQKGVKADQKLTVRP
jgi:enediyne biosynthesis protein E4